MCAHANVKISFPYRTFDLNYRETCSVCAASHISSRTFEHPPIHGRHRVHIVYCNATVFLSFPCSDPGCRPWAFLVRSTSLQPRGGREGAVHVIPLRLPARASSSSDCPIQCRECGDLTNQRPPPVRNPLSTLQEIGFHFSNYILFFLSFTGADSLFDFVSVSACDQG